MLFHEIWTWLELQCHYKFSQDYNISFLFVIVYLFNAGLVDEQQKVRTITALAIAALAEAATPYGIESFDSVLKPLWKGIRTHRGKVSEEGLKVLFQSFHEKPTHPLNIKSRIVIKFGIYIGPITSHICLFFLISVKWFLKYSVKIHPHWGKEGMCVRFFLNNSSDNALRETLYSVL